MNQEQRRRDTSQGTESGWGWARRRGRRPRRTETRDLEVVRQRLPVGRPGAWAKSECRTLLGLVARGSEMLGRRLTVGRTAPGVSSVVHAVGAIVGGEAASVSLVVHAVEAVVSEKAMGLSSVKVRGVAKSELRSLHERGARGSGVPRRRLTVGVTVGATAVGAVMVEIAREGVNEFHYEELEAGREMKPTQKRPNAERMRKGRNTLCLCVRGVTLRSR